MNDKRDDRHDAYRSFQLMTEIESGGAVSQHELAKRLGVAVGLVNSYLKNFVAKGYVRVKNYPRNRYAYLMTPKGFSEKSRLAYQHLNYFNSLCKVTRQDYLALFQVLRERGVSSVTFCGVDEVAEIAFLSLKEVGLELTKVVDMDPDGCSLLGVPVLPLSGEVWEGTEIVVLTSRKRETLLRCRLIDLGVAEDHILSAAGMTDRGRRTQKGSHEEDANG